MTIIQNTEVASNAVIETYIRKGLEANRENDRGETDTVKDYTVLDINWGQYTDLRPGEIYKGKEKAGKTLQEMMKEGGKYIVELYITDVIGHLQS